MPTLAQKTRAFNDMVPEARRLGIFWARVHTSDFADHAGADRQVARLLGVILDSGGRPPEPGDLGVSPEWRAGRSKTPAELRRDQLNAQRARTLAMDATHCRKVADGVRRRRSEQNWGHTDESRAAIAATQRRIWRGDPDRRQAQRERGRRHWPVASEAAAEASWASWDSYTGRGAKPKPLWFDPDFTLEQLAAMTFEDADPFEGWVDDGLPIRTLNDRLDVLHAQMDALLGVRTARLAA